MENDSRHLYWGNWRYTHKRIKMERLGIYLRGKKACWTDVRTGAQISGVYVSSCVENLPLTPGLGRQRQRTSGTRWVVRLAVRLKKIPYIILPQEPSHYGLLQQVGDSSIPCLHLPIQTRTAYISPMGKMNISTLQRLSPFLNIVNASAERTKVTWISKKE